MFFFLFTLQNEKQIKSLFRCYKTFKYRPFEHLSGIVRFPNKIIFHIYNSYIQTNLGKQSKRRCWSTQGRCSYISFFFFRFDMLTFCIQQLVLCPQTLIQELCSISHCLLCKPPQRPM